MIRMLNSKYCSNPHLEAEYDNLFATFFGKSGVGECTQNLSKAAAKFSEYQSESTCVIVEGFSYSANTAYRGVHLMTVPFRNMLELLTLCHIGQFEYHFSLSQQLLFSSPLITKRRQAAYGVLPIDKMLAISDDQT
ncbi:UNVERIFIED_CONTAM: hypothetical protein K2H54_055780 [Gekko kuhli]